jgi:hypothetical protein
MQGRLPGSVTVYTSVHTRDGDRAGRWGLPPYFGTTDAAKEGACRRCATRYGVCQRAPPCGGEATATAAVRQGCGPWRLHPDACTGS